MTDLIMRLSGNEDGEVTIDCFLPRCMKPGPKTKHNPEGLYIDPIVVPYEATPLDVDRIWMQHRIEHSS